MGLLRIRSGHPLHFAAVAAVGLFMILKGGSSSIGPRGLVRLGVGINAAKLGWVVMALGLGLLARRLAARPQVVAGPDFLRARTSPLLRWLTLGGFHKELRVDAATRTIELRQRAAWLWAGRVERRFSEVEYVDYEHRSEGQALDRFSVSVVFTDGGREHLFDFAGQLAEGTSASREESLSRTFARQLTSLLGVGLGPSATRGSSGDRPPPLV